MAPSEAGKYVYNMYRSRKIGRNRLVSADHGQWVILDEKRFRGMRVDDLSGELRMVLHEKGIILDEKNIEEIIDYQRSKNRFMFNGAALHIIVVTKNCNNRCVYCHASAVSDEKQHMDKDTVGKVIDFIFQTPSPFFTIEFQGGEPLTNFDVIKHGVEYALEKNKKAGKKVDFSIVSNLNVLDDEIVDYCRRKRVKICTSLDGPKDVHDCQRTCLLGGSSHENVVSGMDRLRSGGIGSGALITVTKNMLDKEKEVVDEYVKRGIDTIHLRNLNELGYAKMVWKEIGYRAEEFIDFWKRGVDYILELNRKEPGIIRERTVMIFLKKIMTRSDPNFLDIRSPCGAGIGQMTYDVDGSIYSCDEGRMTGEGLFKIGHVDENSYKEVIEGPEVTSLISASLLDTKSCDGCAYKPFCGICPVILHAKQGSIVSNIASSDLCKIHMAQLDYIFEKIAEDKEVGEMFKKWLEMDFDKKRFKKQ